MQGMWNMCGADPSSHTHFLQGQNISLKYDFGSSQTLLCSRTGSERVCSGVVLPCTLPLLLPQCWWSCRESRCSKKNLHQLPPKTACLWAPSSRDIKSHRLTSEFKFYSISTTNVLHSFLQGVIYWNSFAEGTVQGLNNVSIRLPFQFATLPMSSLIVFRCHKNVERLCFCLK